jgi:DNA mismatch repair protein MutS2
LLRKEFEEFREEIEADNSADNERIEREMERLRRRQQRREERKNNPTEPKAEQPQPIKKMLPLEVGAKVRLMGQNGVGVVKEVRGKRAQVAFGAILTTVETARLEVISSAEFKRMTRPETPRTVISADISQRRLNFRSQIDIRGERVVEALEKVQSLVDDALMVGVSTVTILHGKGTGALKEEVRRYLRSLPQVASAIDDHPDRGGSGITIVTFKE